MPGIEGITDPIEVVKAYFDLMDAAISKQDPEALVQRRALVADDIVYANLPLRAVKGKEEHLQWQAEFAGCDYMLAEIRHIAADGDWVLTERYEDYSVNGVSIEGPIMGIFEVRDGQIHTWYDHMSYFPEYRKCGMMSEEFFARWTDD